MLSDFNNPPTRLIMENISCGELAAQLGKMPMHIGKVKNEVCKDEADLDGKLITPAGVLKILAHYGKEMDIIENGQPDIVAVYAIDQQLANPRWLLALDRERNQKVQVNVPQNRKKQLAVARRRLIVERGSNNGEYFYSWKPNLKL